MTDTIDNVATAAATPTFDFAKWEEKERPRRTAGRDPPAEQGRALRRIRIRRDHHRHGGVRRVRRQRGFENVQAERDGEEIDLPTGHQTAHHPLARDRAGRERGDRLRRDRAHGSRAAWRDLWRLEEPCCAFGEFVFDVAAGTIILTFNQRFEDSELFEHVF